MKLYFRENDLVVKISFFGRLGLLNFSRNTNISVPKSITLQMYEFLEFFPASLQNLKPTPLKKFPEGISQHFVALRFGGLPVFPSRICLDTCWRFGKTDKTDKRWKFFDTEKSLELKNKSLMKLKHYLLIAKIFMLHSSKAS